MHLVKNSRTVLLGTFLIATMSAASVVADVTINNEFTCSENKVISYKTGQEVTASSLSDVAKQIKKLKKDIKKLSGARKNKAKRKLAKAKALKEHLVACQSGLLSPPQQQQPQIAAIFSSLVGTYSGEYSGSAAGGAIPLAGLLNATFGLNGTIFSGSITFTSGPLQTVAPLPLEFAKDVGDALTGSQFQFLHSTLGTVTIVVTAGGHITISNQDPAGVVSILFEGDVVGNNITLAMSGIVNGIPFLGELSLFR